MRSLVGVAFIIGTFAPTRWTQGAVHGWFVETRVTTRNEGERAAARPGPREWRQRQWTAAGSTRLEGMPIPFDSANSTYTVTRAGDRNGYLITPTTRTVRVATFEALQGFVTDALGQPPAGALSYKDLGDGGLILGHRTRKFESTISYQLPTSLPGGGAGGQSRQMTMTLWYASDTTDSLVAAWQRRVAATPMRVSPQSPRGMLLRSESRSEGSGVARVGVKEVLVWRQETLDTALFVVPREYRRIDMVEELRANRAASAARLAAQRATFAEMNRLRASTDPADRRKLDRMMDSAMKAIKQRSSALPPVNLRDNPSAVIIDGGSKKKP